MSSAGLLEVVDTEKMPRTVRILCFRPEDDLEELERDPERDRDREDDLTLASLGLDEMEAALRFSRSAASDGSKAESDCPSDPEATSRTGVEDAKSDPVEADEPDSPMGGGGFFRSDSDTRSRSGCCLTAMAAADAAENEGSDEERSAESWTSGARGDRSRAFRACMGMAAEDCSTAPAAEARGERGERVRS